LLRPGVPSIRLNPAIAQVRLRDWRLLVQEGACRALLFAWHPDAVLVQVTIYITLPSVGTLSKDNVKVQSCLTLSVETVPPQNVQPFFGRSGRSSCLCQIACGCGCGAFRC
jgi:hypothetical protein